MNFAKVAALACLVSADDFDMDIENDPVMYGDTTGKLHRKRLVGEDNRLVSSPNVRDCEPECFFGLQEVVND